MANLENLSERDRAVLRSIFDPTATIGEVADDGDNFEEDEGEGVDVSEADQELRSLCFQGVKLAEGNKLDEALDVINKAIDMAPNCASVYNDRAQLFRLMNKDDDAMKDLEHVLKLTESKKTRARALALCQRGLLLRKRGKDDDAREAFAEASKLGSGFAKKQVVELNPYAALCNQMLSQVMKGEKDIKL